MKEKADLVRGRLRKAESDLIALEASLNAGALDAACFHAQQAAEKLVKAFLAYANVDYPFTHNLAKLVEVAAMTDPSFQALLPVVEPLTPYAVELRYDSDFWPTVETAREAQSLALEVKEFVLSLLPEDITPPDHQP